MGVLCGESEVELKGSMEHPSVRQLMSRLGNDSHEINIDGLKRIIEEGKEADKTFKVAFILYAFAFVLCPTTLGRVESSLIIPLVDVNSIHTKNWASFCFHQLVEGVGLYKNNTDEYMSGTGRQNEDWHTKKMEGHLNDGQGMPIQNFAQNFAMTWVAGRRLTDFLQSHAGLQPNKTPAILDTGFGMLQMVRCPHLFEDVCRMMMNNIDPFNQTVVIHGLTHIITPKDFERVIGSRTVGLTLTFTLSETMGF
ncbi:hypothetical protein M0R45_009337 [Rubus argutus]|uniref:Uncharacterized protein n=1 Tax=Rubus argutus TaxID=59490 RepID=A0AAW1Y4I0_RUBAR